MSSLRTRIAALEDAMHDPSSSFDKAITVIRRSGPGAPTDDERAVLDAACVGNGARARLIRNALTLWTCPLVVDSPEAKRHDRFDSKESH